MKCTACDAGYLSPAYLDVMLPCHTCNDCGGTLLRMVDYFRWQDAVEGLDLKKNPPVDVQAEKMLTEDAGAAETTKALMCPKTGGVMTKYRISANTDHRLDFSAAFNAVWLDKGEWELLKQNGLELRLNRIFTDYWQHEIRDQESKETMQELYQRRFGEHYEELKQMRKKLAELPDRFEALAYLSAEDPYRP